MFLICAGELQQKPPIKNKRENNSHEKFSPISQEQAMRRMIYYLRENERSTK